MHSNGGFIIASLIRLHSRQRVVLLTFLLFVGTALNWGNMPKGLALWPDTSVAIQLGVGWLGPLGAGVAAWLAIRERRFGMSDLLTTTTYSPVRRQLVSWLVVSGSVLAAYGLNALVVGLWRAAQLPEAVQQAISRVDLTAQATQRLKTLSGGMIRRVGIAQAIVNRPRLLLDESTVGLDPQQRIAFRALIRELGRDTTVLLSTHLVEDVAAACSEVVIMNGGRFIYQGSPMMLERVGQREVALGDTPLERGYSHVLAHGTSP